MHLVTKSCAAFCIIWLKINILLQPTLPPMAAPKVLQVLKSMSREEIAEMDAIMARQKKSSLKKLYKLLSKTAPDQIDRLDKELAFIQVFGKKYTAESDYLWRNELRLLMDIIEHYAAEKVMRAELEHSERLRSTYFLRYLIDKKLFSLIPSESDRLKEMAAKAYDYNTVQTVCDLMNPLFGNFAWNDIAMQERLAANAETHRDAACHSFLHNFRKAQISRTASQLFRHRGEFKVRLPEADVDAHFTAYEDPYSEYLTLRMETFSTPEYMDPDKYRRCLDHLAQYPGIPDHIKESFLLLNNLSGYYFFRHEYEEAFRYNTELIKIIDKLDPVYGIAAVINYASNLAHLERYDEALTALRKYDPLIRQFPMQMERLAYIEASCYALKGDREAFNATLPRQFDDLSKIMQYHYRFLIALSHFLDKDYALAISEATNIERSIKALKTDKLNYYDEIVTASEHMSRFFELYQEYKLDGSTPRVKKKIAALNADIEHFIQTNKMTSGSLFYRWMVLQAYQLDAKAGPI